MGGLPPSRGAYLRGPQPGRGPVWRAEDGRPRWASGTPCGRRGGRFEVEPRKRLDIGERGWKRSRRERWRSAPVAGSSSPLCPREDRCSGGAGAARGSTPLTRSFRRASPPTCGRLFGPVAEGVDAALRVHVPRVRSTVRGSAAVGSGWQRRDLPRLWEDQRGQAVLDIRERRCRPCRWWFGGRLRPGVRRWGVHLSVVRRARSSPVRALR
jgi:hypothetical protein